MCFYCARILNLLVLYINGADERSRLVRRTLARWVCLSIILLTRGVSVVAKKRFPTLQHLIDAGLMTKEEAEMFDNVNVCCIFRCDFPVRLNAGLLL